MDLNTFTAITLAPTPVSVGDHTFHVRSMTIGEQVAYSDGIKTCEDHTWVFVLIRFTLCTESGELLFPMEPTVFPLQDAIKVLAAKSQLIINPLFDAARKVNGMDSKKDEKKDSGEESSDSPT